ncbi:MAG: metallophosphoesterase [Actinobacteria bacterium]|nr:metallophosphoesterase [Actinomycetota bacterium]
MGGVAGAAVGWGWFEAGWVRLRTLDVVLPRLPEELVGLRIAHLSDFHFGLPSRGAVAAERAVDWARERRPDLVAVTGDLVSRPSGETLLREHLARLGQAYVVLGNHDVEHSRDPFSRSAGLTDLSPARLLVDEAETVELRGRRVQIVGVDPRVYWQGRSRPWELVDEDADLRILLCHFPYVLSLLPPGAFDLVLSGHMHDGQIALPLGHGRKFRFAHPGTRYTTGLYERPGGTMHVSPGLGTTFVPFRFFARPEATELVLQRP